MNLLIHNKKFKTPVALNPLKMDPTRSITLRRSFSQWLTTVFGELKRDIVKFVMHEDVFGLKKNPTRVWNEQKYEFASTQFDIFDPIVTDVIDDIQESLDPDDVVKLEDQPHVTILYGLFDATGTKDAVSVMTGGFGPVSFDIGDLSVFQMPDSEILKFSIWGERLHELNARLALLPNYQSFPDYNPHITIAYLKKGTAQKYLQKTGIEGLSLTRDYLTFSNTEKTHSHIALNTQYTPVSSLMLENYETMDWETRYRFIVEASLTENAGKKASGGNCGIGSGGFQPGNTCAVGGGGGGSTQHALNKVDAAPTVHATADTPGAPRPAVLQRGNLIAPPYPVDTSEKTHKKVREVMSSGTKSTKDVPLDQIVGIQMAVNRDSVKHFIKNDRSHEAAWEQPVIVKVGKKFYLFDGAHRASADILSGKKTIKATVYEMPAKTKTPKSAAKTDGPKSVDEKHAVLPNPGKHYTEYARAQAVKDHPQLAGKQLELKLVEVSSVKPTQSGGDYLNESSRKTAANMKRVVAEGEDAIGRAKDYYPIIVSAKGDILDGNHRHAAHVLNGYKYIWALVEKDVTHNMSLVDNAQEWKYKSQSEAAELFDKWLKGKLTIGPLSDGQRKKWNAFIRKGFEKGAARAFDDTSSTRKQAALDSLRGSGFTEGRREQFIRTSISQATSIEKIRMLEQRAFSEIKGLSEDIRTKAKRAVVDGLVAGRSPRDIASKLQTIMDVSKGRAETIAFTELVRAHADGQLEAMEQLGVTEVGVAVEWNAREGACTLCRPMEGVVLTIQEAKGMIPRHPRCMCAFTPANVGEDAAEKKGQKRGKYKITQAIKQSQKRETKATGDESEWGPNKPISKKRPQSTVFNEEYAIHTFAALLDKVVSRYNDT